AAQMREHAIADVYDIGGTGTEIFIFSSAITSYLHVECQAPGMVGSDPLRDDLICRIRQRIIFKHGDLEFQNVGHLALNRLDLLGDLRPRAFNRRPQCRRLLRGIVARRSPGHSRSQHGDRSDRETRRGSTTDEMDLCHRDQASPKPSCTSASTAASAALLSGPVARKW